MGNCIRHESPMTWGGEDWGSPAEDHRRYGEMSEKDIMVIEEKELLMHDEKKSYVTSSCCNCSTNSMSATNGNCYYGSSSANSSSNSTNTEVKIKISKKQLEELLGKMDVNDMSVQQVLAKLMNVGDNAYETHQLRSWRPALQSIPEVN